MELRRAQKAQKITLRFSSYVLSVYDNIEKIESSISVIMGRASARIIILPADSTFEAMDVCPASLHIDAANSAIKIIQTTFDNDESISFFIPERCAISKNADNVSEIGLTRYKIIMIPNTVLIKTAKSGLSSFIERISSTVTIASSEMRTISIRHN